MVDKIDSPKSMPPLKEISQPCFSYRNFFLSHKSSLSPTKLSEFSWKSPGHKKSDHSLQTSPLLESITSPDLPDENTHTNDRKNKKNDKSRFFTFIADRQMVNEIMEKEPPSGGKRRRQPHRVNTSVSTFSELPSFLHTPLHKAKRKPRAPPNFHSEQEIAELERQREENKELLDHIRLFEGLSDSQRYEMAANMKLQKFKKGEIIVETGLNSNSIYILKKGHIIILDDNDNFLENICPGSCFGENLLLNSKKLYKTIVDSDETECLSISEDEIAKNLGKDLSIMLLRHMVRKSLSLSEFTSGLSNLQREQLVSNMEILCYPKNTMVFTKGSHSNKLIVVIDGTLNANILDITYPPGSILNAQSLMEPEYIFPHSVHACMDVVVAQIDREVVEELIGGDIREILDKNQGENLALNQLLKKKSSLKKNGSSGAAPSVDAKSLYIIKELGDGEMGLVFLCRNAAGDYFALKMMAKSIIIENRLERYVQNEKQIYEILNHPFITKLHSTFRDEISIYFLFEFISGEDFTSVYNRFERLDSNQTRFYISILVIIVGYLHRKGILHRDLKPENLMIDRTGYLKLIDLGTAKLLSYKHSRTYTLLGTPEYTAPEVVLGKGYSFPVDYWAIGVIMYECLTGKLPFGDGETDPMKICEEVVSKELEIPKKIKRKDERELLEQFLSRSPEARSGGSLYSLQSHRWFRDVNWQNILDRAVEPPYIPQIEEKDNPLAEYPTLEWILTQNHFQTERDNISTMTSSFKEWDELF